MVLGNLLTIGEVAKASGVAVSTLRYYDELDLTPNVARTGGNRHFDQESIQRVSFIQLCKSVGLSLKEIQSILDDDSGDWHELVEGIPFFNAKILAVISQIITEKNNCQCQVNGSVPLN